MTLTKEKRAELRRMAEAYAADSRSSVFGPKTMLSVLDELDAAERALADSQLSASMACESPDHKCECAGCSTAASHYRKGSTP